MSETYSEIQQESPLMQRRHAGRSTAWSDAAGIHLSERAFAGHIILRGRSEDQAFCQAATRLLELDLPLKPNSVNRSEGLTVFWLGPDEWLLVTAPDQQADLFQHLRAGLQNLFAGVVDVGSAQTIITLSGSHAVDVIAKGCSVDPVGYLAGQDQCVQTLFAKASVLLWKNADGAFEIVVKRSFADYLWRWLEDAAVEYGIAID